MRTYIIDLTVIVEKIVELNVIHVSDFRHLYCNTKFYANYKGIRNCKLNNLKFTKILQNQPISSTKNSGCVFSSYVLSAVTLSFDPTFLGGFQRGWWYPLSK